MFMNNFVKIILLDLILMIFLEAVRIHVFKKIVVTSAVFVLKYNVLDIYHVFFFWGGGLWYIGGIVSAGIAANGIFPGNNTRTCRKNYLQTSLNFILSYSGIHSDHPQQHTPPFSTAYWTLTSLPCRLDGTYVYSAALVFTVLKITSTAMPTSSTDYAINGNSHSGPRDRNLCRHSFTYTRRSNPHKLITTVDLLNKVNTYLHVTSFYHDRNSQY